MLRVIQQESTEQVIGSSQVPVSALIFLKNTTGKIVGVLIRNNDSNDGNYELHMDGRYRRGALAPSTGDQYTTFVRTYKSIDEVIKGQAQHGLTLFAEDLAMGGDLPHLTGGMLHGRQE